MIVITADRVSGKQVARTLGLVRGNTIRARHIGKDIMAVMRNIQSPGHTPIIIATLLPLVWPPAPA